MILKLHDIKMTIRELLQTFYSCVINLLKYKRQMEMCNVARETRVLGQHGSRRSTAKLLHALASVRSHAMLDPISLAYWRW